MQDKNNLICLCNKFLKHALKYSEDTDKQIQLEQKAYKNKLLTKSEFLKIKQARLGMAQSVIKTASNILNLVFIM